MRKMMSLACARDFRVSIH